jgi:hypothetical protein
VCVLAGTGQKKIQPPGGATLKQLSFQNHPAQRQALANNHSYFAREAPAIKLAKLTAQAKNLRLSRIAWGDVLEAVGWP